MLRGHRLSTALTPSDTSACCQSPFQAQATEARKILSMMDPAPGFDPDIPHDLVHYVVEAELELESGVFGRAAKGGGTFIRAAALGSARQRAREQRKQRRKEKSLRTADEATGREMEASERIAYLSDVAWRRSQGQRPSPSLWTAPEALSAAEAARIARVAARLQVIAPLWRELTVGAAAGDQTESLSTVRAG
jgi:hypothetical protein